MDKTIKDFRTALESLNKIRAERIFSEVSARLTPMEAVEYLVVPALQQIGQGWSEGRLALAQIYMSGRFCEDLVETVLPAGDPDRRGQPRSAIAVLDDYHLLGKRIVYALARASGFELFDYGRMDVAGLVKRATNDGLQVLLISTLMLPSALAVKTVRARLDEAGQSIRLLVGGAPFRLDPQLHREVGADAMGYAAHDAVEILSSWQGGGP